jgi:hypothetical protein
MALVMSGSVRGRHHIGLGEGIPQPPVHLPVPLQKHGPRLPEYPQVVACPILGGLHSEYRFDEQAA